MNDATIVVDGDGHVCEPRDLWTSRLPEHLRDRGIRLRWNPDTEWDEAFCEDWQITDRGLAGLGNAGLTNVDFGRGLRYDPADLQPAGFDAQERLKVMDEEGIDRAILYPGLGFSLGAIKDPELGAASCRVYNDWIAEFCSADPGRLVGVAAIPMQDPQAACDEARRAVEDLGLRGTFVRPNPHAPGPLYDRAYDPVYDTLAELGVPLGLHPAGLADLEGAARGMGLHMAGGTHHALILLFDQYVTLSNLVYGGVLERHPDLKVLVLECGGGWIAHWCDRLDEFLESYDWAAEDLSLKPSEYFQRQGWISFDPGERTAKAMGELVGTDRLIWASDFPHSDAKYPGVVEELMEHASALDDEAQRRYVGGNALELYGLTL